MSLSPSSTGNLIFVLVCELLLRLGMEGYTSHVYISLSIFTYHFGFLEVIQHFSLTFDGKSFGINLQLTDRF